MKYNYGTINRPIKIKKRVEKSPHIINLTPEALQWEILSKALRKRIRKNENQGRWATTFTKRYYS